MEHSIDLHTPKAPDILYLMILKLFLRLTGNQAFNYFTVHSVSNEHDTTAEAIALDALDVALNRTKLLVGFLFRSQHVSSVRNSRFCDLESDVERGKFFAVIDAQDVALNRTKLLVGFLFRSQHVSSVRNSRFCDLESDVERGKFFAVIDA